jgi:hypothetical protein
MADFRPYIVVQQFERVAELRRSVRRGRIKAGAKQAVAANGG